MTDFVHLVGAEDVRRAASTIHEAAQGMQRAASDLSGVLDLHRRRTEDLVQRFEAAVDRLVTAIEKAEPASAALDALPPPPPDDPEIVRLEIPHDRLPSLRQFFVYHVFFEVPGNNPYEALRMVNGQRATLVVYQNENERLKVVAGPDQPAVRGLLRAWRDRP